MQDNILTLHSINPTGMFSYGESKDINVLNKGLVHLTGINEDKDGDSNGSGKSSLFNAACEILFRENPTGCKGDDVINSIWDKGMAGRVYFTNHIGEHYRVTYCRSWKETNYAVDNDTHTAYLGTSLYLDKFEDGVWVDKRGSGMPQTHLKILDVIGMSYNRFLAIAYMSYRVGDAFLRGTNKDRMEILSGITGIEEWDSISDRSRAKKKALNTQISAIDDKVNFEKGALQTLQEQYQSAKAFDWAEYIEQEEAALAASRVKWKEIADKIKNYKNIVEDLTAKQSEAYNQEKVDSTDKEIRQNNEKIQKLDKEMWTTPTWEGKEVFTEPKPINPNLDKKGHDLMAELDDLKAMLSETRDSRSACRGQLQGFVNDAGSLMDLTRCPTCDTSITKKKKESIGDKIKELEDNCTLLEAKETKLQEVSIKGATARLEARQLVLNREYEGQMETYKAALAAQEKETDRRLLAYREGIATKKTILVNQNNELMNNIKLERDIHSSYASKLHDVAGTIQGLRDEQDGFKSKGLDHKNKIDQANKSVDQLKAAEAQIEEKKLHLDFFVKEIAEVQGNLDVFLWLIDNIPFIKLHKMSVAMAEISDLANEYLEDLGDSMRISITSFEHKSRQKNAADVKALMKSDVKIEIVDGSKNISPKLYSDGEASKISVAIIRALNELARKYGQGCNLMLLDEVFSFVDSNNSQKIASSMSKLLKKGTVFVTDNSGAVKDLIDFDHTWTARKRSGQTELEV